MLEVPVSVIIPCFNSEKTILKSLESVKAQSVKVFEIICIDDCSKDNTVECIRKYSQQNPQLNLKIFINEVNRGPSYSRNLGWDKAHGKYIAFLDADDVWHPEKIAIQYSWMTNNSHVSMSSHYHFLVKSLEDLDPRDVEYEPITRKFKNEILFFNPFETSSIMLKQDLAYRFKSNKRYCEDHLLWMEICLDGNEVYMLNTPLVYAYRRCEGLSSNKLRMRYGEITSYWHLFKIGKLNFAQSIFLSFYSLLKFIASFLLPNNPAKFKSLPKYWLATGDSR